MQTAHEQSDPVDATALLRENGRRTTQSVRDWKSDSLAAAQQVSQHSRGSRHLVTTPLNRCMTKRACVPTPQMVPHSNTHEHRARTTRTPEAKPSTVHCPTGEGGGYIDTTCSFHHSGRFLHLSFALYAAAVRVTTAVDVSLCSFPRMLLKG